MASIKIHPGEVAALTNQCASYSKVASDLGEELGKVLAELSRTRPIVDAAVRAFETTGQEQVRAYYDLTRATWAYIGATR